MSTVSTQAYMPQGDIAQTWDDKHAYESQVPARNAYGHQPSTGLAFTWMLAAGIVSIISGVALAIIGALSFAFGDIVGGVWAIVSAVSSIGIGSAIIAFDFWLYH